MGQCGDLGKGQCNVALRITMLKHASNMGDHEALPVSWLGPVTHRPEIGRVPVAVRISTGHIETVRLMYAGPLPVDR